MCGLGGTLSFDTMRLFFSLLAFAATVVILSAILLWIAARLSAAAAEMRDAILDSVAGYELWMAFGTAYTLALLLMLAGLVGLSTRMRGVRGRVPRIGDERVRGRVERT